jgi:hypothetical protein
MALLILMAMALTAQIVTADTAQHALNAEGLVLSKMAFGTGVSERELEGQAETFRLGERVYCWTLLEGGRPGDLVRHVWFLGDKEIQSIELSVASASWRTWSYKTLYPGMAGAWRVEVLDTEGKMLGVQSFSVTE